MKTKFKDTEIGKIPEDWEVYSLSELYEFCSGLSKSKNDFGFGYPFLSYKDIFDNFFVPEHLGSLANTTKKERMNCSVKGGDVFLTRTSETADEIGVSCVALRDYPNATFNGFTKRLRPKNKEKIYPEFEGYYFRDKRFRNHVSSMCTLTTRASLNNEILGKLKITLPPFKIQVQIASILKPLDDKIDLLQKQNKTLEAIGQAIFKHWFVDFEFPNEEGKPYKSSGGEMVDSELGAIPKDWKVNQLKDFGDIICGKTPPKSNKEYFEGDIPFIKIPDMHNQLFVINTEDSLTKEGKEYQENKTIPEKSICVSCIATVGLVSLTSKESQTNQQINSIIPKNSYSTYYLHYMLKSMYQLLQDYGSGGSATLNINTKTFSKIKVLSPKDEVIKEFHKKVNSIFDKILNNLNENNSLSQIRDSLLPKLMSGKIRVPVEVE